MKPLFYASLFLAFITSCNEEDSQFSDVTKPVINLISPSNGTAFEAGDDHGVHIEMELSDDVALASYKIDIHFNDGHEHRASEPAHEEEWTSGKWTFDDIEGLKNSHIHHHEVKIPAHAKHGEYHFMVYCTDQAGNETFVVKDIEIGAHGDHDHEHEH